MQNQTGATPYYRTISKELKPNDVSRDVLLSNFGDLEAVQIFFFYHLIKILMIACIVRLFVI
jgi:hypothetical protein